MNSSTYQETRVSYNFPLSVPMAVVFHLFHDKTPKFVIGAQSIDLALLSGLYQPIHPVVTHSPRFIVGKYSC